MKRDESLDDLRPKDPTDLSEQHLAYKAGPLAAAFQGRIPTGKELRNISEELGVDMATTILLKTLQDSVVHGEFARRVRRTNLDDIKNAYRDHLKQVEVVIVASNLYQSGRRWGDHVELWGRWAREMGFTTEVVATDPKVSVSSNARFIVQFLEANPHPRRIMVTYGQGTSELRLVMQRRFADKPSEIPDWAKGIRGWINVCGSFHGAMSSDLLLKSKRKRILTSLKMRLAGRNPIVLKETSPSFPFWKPAMPKPEEMSITSIVAVPQRWEVPGDMREMHHQLGRKYPNDGAVSFYEATAHPGHLMFVPGMSHRAESIPLEPVLKRAIALTAVGIFKTDYKAEIERKTRGALDVES